MFEKNSLDYEHMNNQFDYSLKSYSAQTTATYKQTKVSSNIPNSYSTISGNNLKQSSDFYDERLQSNKGIINTLDVYYKEDGRLNTAYTNSKLNHKLNSPSRIPHENKYISESTKRNQNINFDLEDEEEMNINCNESDVMNLRGSNQYKKSQCKVTERCGEIIENIETQCDEDADDLDQDIDEDDTSSEFIKELLQNEKKLTQKIYCSEKKALKVTKIFNDLIFCMKSELLAYLTLEDICRFKKAFQYYLGRSVTKTIDAQILKLIWTSEPINNQLLWDTLINYSYFKQQYPFQYKVNYFY